MARRECHQSAIALTETHSLSTLSASNIGSLLAYSTDTNGSERYTLVVKDLETGEMWRARSRKCSGAQSGPPTTLPYFYTSFYTSLDETGHPYQVRRHIVGGLTEDDTVVYE